LIVCKEIANMHNERQAKLIATLGSTSIAVVAIFFLSILIRTSTALDGNPMLALVALLVAIILPVFTATRIAYRAGFEEGERQARSRNVQVNGTRSQTYSIRLLDDRFRRLN
jgi:hypothetical protein